MESSIFYTNNSILPNGDAQESYLLPLLVGSAPQLLAPLILLPLLGYFTYKDYCLFLSLGRGGTPYNFYGYLTITFLRLFTLRNPRIAGTVPRELIGTGYLSRDLPKRNYPRPTVMGIAPHRQTNQKPSKEIFDLLSTSLTNLAHAYPSRLRIATSCFEKHCPGLFSRKQVNKTCNGEICHAHPSDGSLHMTLHPEDAETVILAGFGERHPLARGGWCTRFVPQGFLMIYAPRTEAEVKIVMQIVHAGIGWVSGEKLDEKLEVDIIANPPSTTTSSPSTSANTTDTSITPQKNLLVKSASSTSFLGRNGYLGSLLQKSERGSCTGGDCATEGQEHHRRSMVEQGGAAVMEVA